MPAAGASADAEDRAVAVAPEAAGDPAASAEVEVAAGRAVAGEGGAVAAAWVAADDARAQTERPAAPPIPTVGAAATIVALARRPALTTTDQGKRIVADRALAARVRVALMSHEDTREARHDTVEAQDGRVHVMTAGAPDAVARVARAVEGVAGVTIEEETPVLPPMSLM